MPIEGPVTELAPGDLLQLLYLSRRSGRLRAESGSGEWLEIRLNDGALCGASSSDPELRLGRLLEKAGRITRAQVAEALEVQASAAGLRLGERLVRSELVPVREVERQLTFQVEEAIFDLLRWPQGQVRFEEAEERCDDGVEIRLRTDAVLMEAARRLDELAEVAGGAHGADPVPRLAPASDEEPLTLETLEWEVLGAIDGARSVRTIARELGRSELEVARAVYALAESRVVELSREAPREEAAVTPEMVEAAIQDGQFEEADRLLQTLTAHEAGDPRLALFEGRIAAGRGAWNRAISALERAARAGVPEAYYHLARAAIRGGVIERAVPALRVYQRMTDRSPERRASAARMAAALEALDEAARSGEP